MSILNKDPNKFELPRLGNNFLSIEKTPKKVGILNDPGEYDLTDLEQDKKFSEISERFLSSIGEENGDIFEYMRDADFNLYSAMKRMADSGKFTKQQQEDYKYLRQKFDGANIGSIDQFFKLVGDGAIDMITDPTLIAAALFTPFTGGGSLAARAVFGKGASNGLKLLNMSSKKAMTSKQIADAVADGSLEQAAKNATTLATGFGALEAGGWMGLHNHANQNIELNTKIRTLYSKKELVGQTALGAVAGGLLGRYTQKFINYNNPVLNINKTPTVYSDSALGNLRLKFNKGLDNFLGRTFLGNARFFKTLQDQGVENARLFSATLDHDSQLRIGTRATERVAWSFPELLNGRRGQYLFGDNGFWKALEDIAPDGKLNQEVELDILRYLRGNKKAISKYGKDVKKSAEKLRKWFDGIAKDAKDAGFGDIRIKDYFPREWNRKAIRENREELVELLAKDLKDKNNKSIGVDEANKIVDDMLNINNELYSSHSNLLTHGRKLNINDNKYEKFLINELVDVGASYGLNAANTIQTKITFLGGKLPPKVRKALDLKGKDVMVFDDLKADRLKLFEENWIKPLEEELARMKLPRLTRLDKRNMVKSFESVTGQVKFYENQIVQGLYDSLKLANAMAFLPLATVSSLSEALITAARVGPKKSAAKFHEQLYNGYKFLTTDLKSLLVERRGLSKIQANRDANKAFIAVDDVQADLVNRLAGDALRSPGLNRVARTFYKANLLLPWTKTIELAAFNTGRDVAIDSLRALKKFQDEGINIFDDAALFAASKGKDSPALSAQLTAFLRKLDSLDGQYTGKSKNVYDRITFLKEQLNSLGIDTKQGIRWLKGGAKEATDFYQKELTLAGGRFSRSIILPTSREFSKVPQFMTNPMIDIFTQFLRYPTAFSNTVLKNFARDAINNPQVNAPRVVGFVATSSIIARGTNYWRGSDLRQEEYDALARDYSKTPAGQFADKILPRSSVEALDSFQRVGLLGQFEYIKRIADATEFSGGSATDILGLGGPIMSDITGVVKYDRGPFETLARKTPGIGLRYPLERATGFNPYDDIIEGGKRIDEGLNEAINAIAKSIRDVRLPRATGGLVREELLNVGRMRYESGGEVEQLDIDERVLKFMGEIIGKPLTEEHLEVMRQHEKLVSYAESDSIADRVQMDGGPGRGLHQYEMGDEQGAATGRNRLLNLEANTDLVIEEAYKKQLGELGPDSLDVSKLPESLQRAIFYADKIYDENADVYKLLTGETSHNDFWYMNHYRKDNPEKQNFLNDRIKNKKD